jgi:hypothetical protein
MWRGRDRQTPPLGSSRPRHRSESRRLSDRQLPVNTVPRKRDHRPGALDEGDPVQVFSRSADKWVEGEIVTFVEDNFVRVEYYLEDNLFGKTLHLHSEHLVIPSRISNSDGKQHPPETIVVGDRVRVFSGSHQAHFDGKVVGFATGVVRIEYLLARADGLVETRYVVLYFMEALDVQLILGLFESHEDVARQRHIWALTVRKQSPLAGFAVHTVRIDVLQNEIGVRVFHQSLNVEVCVVKHGMLICCFPMRSIRIVLLPACTHRRPHPPHPRHKFTNGMLLQRGRRHYFPIFLTVGVLADCLRRGGVRTAGSAQIFTQLIILRRSRHFCTRWRSLSARMVGRAKINTK